MHDRIAEITEIIGIAIHEHEDAHLEGVSLKQRLLAAHVADAVLLYLRAQIEDLPHIYDPDIGNPDDDEELRNEIDRRAVLELLGSSLSAVPGTETDLENAKSASTAVGRDVR